MSNENVKTADLLIKSLVEDYAKGIAGKQPFVEKSMVIAYERGVKDALAWVKAFNDSEKNKQEKPNLILAP